MPTMLGDLVEIERCSRGNAVALPLLRRDNLGSEQTSKILTQ
jgi:hypothetical protein